MCVLAHPDDESLGVGGTLAKYSQAGVETYLITATRGERGRYFDNSNRPEMDEVGRVREEELRKAAAVLGVREVFFLDYIDGDLDSVNPAEAIAKIVDVIRHVKPHVVITFGPEGGYGHPDHIAISQFAVAACAAAGGSVERPPDGESGREPWVVPKLYFMAWTKEKWEAYQKAFKDLKTTIDGMERRATPWLDWAVTTRIDTSDVWTTVWKAITCHQTQMAIYSKLEELNDKYHQFLWGSQEFYRVYSLVNGGRKVETDIFEGLRDD